MSGSTLSQIIRIGHPPDHLRGHLCLITPRISWLKGVTITLESPPIANAASPAVLPADRAKFPSIL
jgi:hypothetical protein